MINAGHSEVAVKKYTQRQIELYFQAVQREKNHHKADMIEAINLGFGGGKDLSQYINKLRG